MSVSVGPGWMLLIVRPRGPRSRARKQSENKGVGSLFSRSFRSSAWPQGGFHPKSFCHPPHPGFFSEGAASLHAEPESLQFRFVLGTSHSRQPVPWPFHGPIAEPGRQLGLPLRPSPQARPLPCFRSINQVRPQCIALHIARDRQEMLIGLYRKRFKAALIDRSGPSGMMVRMPALGVGDGDPPQHL